MTNRHIKKKKSSVFKEVQDSKIEEEETKFIEYVKMTPAEKELHKKKENELANSLKKNILGLAIKKIKSQHPKKKRVADLAEIEVEGVNVKDLYMKMSTMKRSGKAAAELYESASEAATPKRRNGIEETSFDSHDFPSSDEDEFNDLNVREDSKLLDITPDPSPTKVKFGKSQDGNSKKHKNPMKPKSILKKSDNKPEIDQKSSLKKKVKSKEENKIFEASFESESDSTQSEHNAKPKMSRKATGREINMNDKKINFTPQEESYSTINDNQSEDMQPSMTIDQPKYKKKAKQAPSTPSGSESESIDRGNQRAEDFGNAFRKPMKFVPSSHESESLESDELDDD